MTNTIAHTTTALLNAAVSALETANRNHKKETGVQLFALGQDMGHGVTFRELKAWAKEFKAKQASVEPKATETKPAAKVVAPKAAEKVSADFTTAELKGSDILIGRTREKIVSVVKTPEGYRAAVVESGQRIPVSNIERNNRGNLRVKLEAAKVEGKPAAVKPAAAANKPAEVSELKTTDVRDHVVLIGRAKETVIRVVKDHEKDARVAVTNKGSRILFNYIERNNRGNLRVKPGTEEMAVTVKAASKSPAAPVKAGLRTIEIGKSTNIAGASYDKARKTLIVTFKSGSVYEYSKVTLADVKAWEAAESKGSHFSKVLKPMKEAVCIVKAPRANKAA